MVRSKNVDRQALANEMVADSICVDPFELQPHLNQCSRELHGSLWSNPNIDQGVGVLRLPSGKLAVLHPVKKDHLTADEYPAAGGKRSEEAEERP